MRLQTDSFVSAIYGSDAATARVRAERKCGELLRDMDKAKGSDVAGRTSLDGRSELPSNHSQTLSEMGVTKDQSRWQKKPTELWRVNVGTQLT